jgi:hypothetical protein
MLACFAGGIDATIEPGGALDRAVEAWFVERGLPHFIPSYRPSRDILTRAAPLLTVVFVLECVLAVKQGWPWWLDVVAAAAGVGVVLTAWTQLNRLRHRPAWSRPTRVGAPELTVFVLVPALTRWQLHDANPLTTVAANLGLVVAIYFGTSYGVIPLLRWAAVCLVRQLSHLVGLVARALPLLLLFVTFFFLTGEVWQLVGNLYGASYWLTIALFASAGIAFMFLRVPSELARLERFSSWDDVRGHLDGTPLDASTLASADGLPAPAPSRRERANAMLVLVFNQGVQTIAVVAVLAGFLTVFGILAMQEETVRNYILTDPHVVAEWQLFGERQVSEELLRVVGFLASFSGLYFTVVGLTDQVYRDEFVESALGEIRQALAVRAAHRALRTTSPG